MSYWETVRRANGDVYAGIVAAIDWNDPGYMERIATLARAVVPERSIREWVLEFVNSSDVAAYLGRCSYKLWSSEAAWIVHESRRRPLSEKICAWACIATELGNAADEPRPWGAVWKERFGTVSDALEHFLPGLARAVDAFFLPKEGELYQYRIVSPRGKEWAPWDAAFRTFGLCMAQAEQELADEPSPKRVQVRKRVLDTWYDHGEAFFVDGILVRVSSGWENDDELSAMEQFFDSMWLSISTPFGRGDVLYDPWSFECSPLSGGGPIVVEEFAYERFEGQAPVGADSFDMSVMGYFQNEDGSIFYEVLPGYLNLERCPEDLLTGKRSVMRDLGDLLKGKCYLDRFANRCAAALLDSARESFASPFDGTAALEVGD